MRKILVVVCITNAIVLCMSANIIGKCIYTIFVDRMKNEEPLRSVNHSKLDKKIKLIICWYLDFLMSGDEGRQDNGPGSRNCICNGPSCICCLDLNISFVNLGGPGKR